MGLVRFSCYVSGMVRADASCCRVRTHAFSGIESIDEWPAVKVRCVRAPGVLSCSLSPGLGGSHCAEAGRPDGAQDPGLIVLVYNTLHVNYRHTRLVRGFRRNGVSTRVGKS
jgi:hypothetical protein